LQQKNANHAKKAQPNNKIFKTKKNKFMKLTKTHYILIGVVALVAVWYFFMRKPSEDATTGTTTSGMSDAAKAAIAAKYENSHVVLNDGKGGYGGGNVWRVINGKKEVIPQADWMIWATANGNNQKYLTQAELDAIPNK
jgi:hypothetical protein